MFIFLNLKLLNCVRIGKWNNWVLHMERHKRFWKVRWCREQVFASLDHKTVEF